jgi:ribosome maturation factor RimP
MGKREGMEVEAMIRPVVEGAGLELVEADFHREAGRRLLRVTVERDPASGRLDLDTISDVSERISRRLDLEGFDPPGGPYTLEVSSPGIERPLRTPRDFERHVGEPVRVRTHRPVDGARSHAGTLVGSSAEGLVVRTGTGDRAIPFDAVASARTVFEWGGRPKQQSAGRSKKVTR